MIVPVASCGREVGRSSLQAFPEKDRRDYGLWWLQVVTLRGWGTRAACPNPLVIQDVVCVAQINIIMYNPLSNAGACLGAPCFLLCCGSNDVAPKQEKKRPPEAGKSFESLVSASETKLGHQDSHKSLKVQGICA